MLHVIKKKNPLHFVWKVSICFWLEVSLLFSVAFPQFISYSSDVL